MLLISLGLPCSDVLRARNTHCRVIGQKWLSTIQNCQGLIHDLSILFIVLFEAEPSRPGDSNLTQRNTVSCTVGRVESEEGRYGGNTGSSKGPTSSLPDALSDPLARRTMDLTYAADHKRTSLLRVGVLERIFRLPTLGISRMMSVMCGLSTCSCFRVPYSHWRRKVDIVRLPCWSPMCWCPAKVSLTLPAKRCITVL